jgi:hypothetical protein
VVLQKKTPRHAPEVPASRRGEQVVQAASEFWAFRVFDAAHSLVVTSEITSAAQYRLGTDKFGWACGRHALHQSLAGRAVRKAHRNFHTLRIMILVRSLIFCKDVQEPSHRL